jgi:hypothetical protein
MDPLDNAAPPRAFSAGKALCIFSAFTYGVLPAIIDTFDPHHLQNPDWPPHARLHLMWLISAGLYTSLFSIYLFWTATPQAFERMRVGAILGALHIAGFFTAGLFKDAAGAAFDADGRVILGFLPPALLHFSTSASLLLAGFALCRTTLRRSPEPRGSMSTWSKPLQKE